MIFFNKRVSAVFVLALSICLSSCGSEESGGQREAQKAEKAEKAHETENTTETLSSLEKNKKAYKAKVNKRVGNVVYNAAVKELGKVGVTELQVKCVLKERSYTRIVPNKETPEVKAIFEGCGVDMEQLKGWYD